MTPRNLLKAAVVSVALAGLAAASTGCTIEPEVGYVEYPPQGIASGGYPYVTYGGYPTYFYEGQWYYANSGRWYVYRHEPEGLYRQRGYFEGHPRYAAPPARPGVHPYGRPGGGFGPSGRRR